MKNILKTILGKVPLWIIIVLSLSGLSTLVAWILNEQEPYRYGIITFIVTGATMVVFVWLRLVYKWIFFKEK